MEITKTLHKQIPGDITMIYRILTYYPYAIEEFEEDINSTLRSGYFDNYEEAEFTVSKRKHQYLLKKRSHKPRKKRTEINRQIQVLKYKIRDAEKDHPEYAL